MKYRRVIQAFQATPWAILPSKLQEIIGFLQLKSAGANISEEEVREQFLDDERDTQEPQTPQSVAVIPIFGVLSRRMNMMTRASGGTSLAVVSKALREAIATDTVKSIILDVDSPGGEVMGVTELHAEILKARRKKPVVAHVSGTAASAAFHLASAAEEIVATPSAMIGSIGVIGVHIDESKAMGDAGLGVTIKTAGKFKADASGLVPLSEEGGEELQRRVDESFDVMIRDIAKGRKLSVARVRKDFGDARIVESKLALELGMIDRVEIFSETLARATGNKSRQLSAVESAIEVVEIDQSVTTTTSVLDDGTSDEPSNIGVEVSLEQISRSNDEEQFLERTRIESDAAKYRLTQRRISS